MASQSPHRRVGASQSPHWRILAASALLALLLFSPPVPARAMDAAEHGGTDGGDHGMDSHGRLASRDVSISKKRVLRKKLKKFVDLLPLPPVVNADRLSKDFSRAAALTITAFSVKRKFHRDLPLTRVYAFGLTRKSASVPGPTIVARVGAPLHVTWQNNITDEQHIMPVDYTLMAPKLKKGGVPISTCALIRIPASASLADTCFESRLQTGMYCYQSILRCSVTRTFEKFMFVFPLPSPTRHPVPPSPSLGLQLSMCMVRRSRAPTTATLRLGTRTGERKVPSSNPAITIIPTCSRPAPCGTTTTPWE
ncbi:unnamed protein product [Closterium sp. NIES-54]